MLPAGPLNRARPAALFQRAGSVVRPLATPIAVEADRADDRVTVLRFTAPTVERISTFLLRVDTKESIPILVFPVETTRQDLPSLAAALKASQLRLLVCGRSPELRRFLKERALKFEDGGADPPHRLETNTLLISNLAMDDWRQLTATAPDGARLLGFVDDDTLLAGVYSQRGPRGAWHIKVNLPLLPLLASDPRARQTLATLLYDSLAPAAP